MPRVAARSAFVRVGKPYKRPAVRYPHAKPRSSAKTLVPVRKEDVIMSVPRYIPVGLPGCIWRKLKYVDSVAIDPGADALAVHRFRTNNIFDPDRTGTGHQPMHFDQFALPYEHYTIYSSKIKMTYIKNIAAATIPGVFGIYIDANATTSYTSAEQIIEGAERSSKWLVTEGIEPMGRSVTMAWNAKKYFGVASLASISYKAPVGGAPADEADFVCYLGDIGGNDPAGAFFLIEIEYVALFTEKTFVAQS